MEDLVNIHSIGGHERSKALSPKQKSTIAKKAASIRWANNGKPQASKQNKGKIK